ncbi:hypothetical protein GC722_04105 [Auraticoccus sp. F435]|uniref:DUF218 domain-containing protein n=2 Tax=Auraticoccus cholistanensis TaxID=2656650 RepID=A0A6A9UQN9_9ACTN|nr:ElyC/SanA/YdcF family protein [Auraticoccus cholistanensis]MVA75216.1 hypothetical protein [Auraticoccus cholistanensis]
MGLGVLAGVGGEVLLRRAGRRVLEPHQLTGPRVAVVLGAQTYPDGRPSRFLRGRLEVARRLHADGRVTTVVVSGDDRAPSHHESQAMRRWLVEAGVPAEDVVLDAHGYDTYDTCWRARHVLGLDSVVLVSQSYHLPRALLTARLVGLDAVGVGDDSVRGTATWRSGVVRERFALLKLLRDVATRRRPDASPPLGRS